MHRGGFCDRCQGTIPGEHRLQSLAAAGKGAQLDVKPLGGIEIAQLGERNQMGLCFVVTDDEPLGGIDGLRCEQHRPDSQTNRHQEVAGETGSSVY